MGRRLILDTNILIAYERGTMDRSSLDDDELAIASVSVAEYRVGIELADTSWAVRDAASRSLSAATNLPFSSAFCASQVRRAERPCPDNNANALACQAGAQQRPS